MKKTLISLALVAAGGISASAMAADCATTVEGNDQMQFNVKSIDVPKSCKQFTITLKHVGKMPKSAMGHNFVVTTTADANATAADGIKAGLAADYVKTGDARVIGHTKIIGGGESADVVIDTAKLKAGTEYTYFCSFPGHSFIMRGTLKIGS